MSQTSYRWNSSGAAEAYDEAAPAIHPFYDTVQDQIVGRLPFAPEQRFLALDLGGGSGRLLERILPRFAAARAMLVDQSEPFLALAERRLRSFAPRVTYRHCRLQDNWAAELPVPPDAIVSTSAIHHLEPAEKRTLFERCFLALKQGGVLINGDEYRPAADPEYRALLEKWSAHMYSACDAGRIPAAFRETIDKWHERNISRFGEPKSSGDDCLETIATQRNYLHHAGFDPVDVVWNEDLWAVVVARKPTDSS